jgi:hypothetical protein
VFFLFQKNFFHEIFLIMDILLYLKKFFIFFYNFFKNLIYNKKKLSIKFKNVRWRQFVRVEGLVSLKKTLKNVPRRRDKGPKPSPETHH